MGTFGDGDDRGILCGDISTADFYYCEDLQAEHMNMRVNLLY